MLILATLDFYANETLEGGFKKKTLDFFFFHLLVLGFLFQNPNVIPL